MAEGAQATPDHDERIIRPFADWLLEQRDGMLAHELSKALNELVDTVRTLGKGGELHLKIKVSPRKGSGHSVDVSDNVTTKLPEPVREERVFFVDDHGNLTRENPAQPSFDSLRAVQAEANTEPKEVHN